MKPVVNGVVRIFHRLFHHETLEEFQDRQSVHRAVLNRARRAARAGQFLLARSLVEECEHFDRDPACLNVLGLIAEARKECRVAQRCWSSALQRDAGYLPAYNNLLRRLELSRWGQSATRVDWGDEPESTDAHHTVSQ